MERQGRRAPPSETARCDYCRKSFGLILHRYYRMRFCSADCLKAYQGRLDDLTMTRIHRVDRQARSRTETAITRRPPAGAVARLCDVGLARRVCRVAGAAELSARYAHGQSQPKRTHGHGSVNVACSRCWPRSACAPPALPRPVSAARSAPDSAYLLTQAPQSLPHLPCRVARCARSCPMSLAVRLRDWTARADLALQAGRGTHYRTAISAERRTLHHAGTDAGAVSTKKAAGAHFTSASPDAP